MIEDLIVKRILGTITAEETKQLDEWRAESEANEKTYQDLMDKQFLEREYRRRNSISYERPLAEMKARIGANVVPLYKRKWFVSSAAAVVAVIFGIGATWLAMRNSGADEAVVAQETSTITPGEMKATLCLANGKTVELGADSAENTINLQKNMSGKSAGKTLAKNNELITPRGGEFKIVLEDGTEVWLNAESKLTYPEEFSEKERRVSVSGEAYFKVAHNADKPFLVETDGQVVKVLGTEFNIHSYSDDNEVLTTLVDGSIAMHPVGSESSELYLTPGHQASFSKGAHDLTVKKVDTEVVTGWRKGLFVFEDQNLRQIMKTLSRWYDFEYKFADSKAANTEFMGSIPRYSDFADVAEILEKSGGLKFKINGKQVVIQSLTQALP